MLDHCRTAVDFIINAEQSKRNSDLNKRSGTFLSYSESVHRRLCGLDLISLSKETWCHTSVFFLVQGFRNSSVDKDSVLMYH